MARKRAMKWNDLHLRPRVESITEDNVESNCSMIENIPPKRVSFSAHPTNPVEGCADANPKTELPNDT